jgi:hypothetical protein
MGWTSFNNSLRGNDIRVFGPQRYSCAAPIRMCPIIQRNRPFGRIGILACPIGYAARNHFSKLRRQESLPDGVLLLFAVICDGHTPCAATTSCLLA